MPNSVCDQSTKEQKETGTKQKNMHVSKKQHSQIYFFKKTHKNLLFYKQQKKRNTSSVFSKQLSK